MKELGIAGVIGRFKPVHKGAALMLETICEKADEVLIGMGSCNKYNARNPFTPEETKEMLELVLSPRFTNYSVIYIPDFAHIPEYSDGQKWREYVVKQFGKLGCLISGNEYVRELLANDYKIVEPFSLIPPEKQLWLKGSHVRLAIAEGKNWEHLVPDPVAEYIKKNRLQFRLTREFGLAILAELINDDYYKGPETKEQEYKHTLEVY